MSNYTERSKEAFSKIRVLDYYMEGHKGFIAGGCFKNLFAGERIKDIDVFFLNQSDYENACAFFEEEDKYFFFYENKNVKCFKNKDTGVKVELIHQSFGTPREILSKFDFTITKFAYAKRNTPEGIEYYSVFIDTFFEDMTNRKLVIDEELLFPVSSFERSYRYKGYGYGLCRESKAKIIEALRQANLDQLSQDLYFGID